MIGVIDLMAGTSCLILRGSGKKNQRAGRYISFRIQEFEQDYDLFVREVEDTAASGQFRVPLKAPYPAQVVSPKILSKTSPSYTPEARQAKVQGDVVIQLVVRKDGSADGFKVIEPLGYGLDERAIKDAPVSGNFSPAP